MISTKHEFPGLDRRQEWRAWLCALPLLLLTCCGRIHDEGGDEFSSADPSSEGAGAADSSSSPLDFRNDGDAQDAFEVAATHAVNKDSDPAIHWLETAIHMDGGARSRAENDARFDTLRCQDAFLDLVYVDRIASAELLGHVRAAKRPGSPAPAAGLALQLKAYELNEAAWKAGSSIGATQRDLERALESATQAWRIRPYDPWVTNTLGVIRFRSGLFDGALQALSFAKNANADLPDEERYHPAADGIFLAMTYWHLGLRTEARSELLRVQEERNGSLPEELAPFLEEARLLIGEGSQGPALGRAREQQPPVRESAETDSPLRPWRAVPAYCELGLSQPMFLDVDSGIVADIDGRPPIEILISDRQGVEIFRLNGEKLARVKRMNLCTESQFEDAYLLGVGAAEGSQGRFLFELVRDGGGLGYRIMRQELSTKRCMQVVEFDGSEVLNAGNESITYGFGDFTGDGYPELIAFSSSTIHCWEAGRNGQYSKTTLHRKANGGVGYRVADFTGDGALDVFRWSGSIAGQGINEVLTWSGDGYFGVRSPFGNTMDGIEIPFEGFASEAMPANLDDQGGVDLLLGGTAIVGMGKQGCRTLGNQYHPLSTFSLPTFDATILRPYVAPDLNRDKIPDIVAINAQNRQMMRVGIIGPTSAVGGSARDPLESILDTGTSIISYLSADVNADELEDVVVWGNDPPAVCVLIARP